MAQPIPMPTFDEVTVWLCAASAAIIVLAVVAWVAYQIFVEGLP